MKSATLESLKGHVAVSLTQLYSAEADKVCP